MKFWSFNANIVLSVIRIYLLGLLTDMTSYANFSLLVSIYSTVPSISIVYKLGKSVSMNLIWLPFTYNSSIESGRSFNIYILLFVASTYSILFGNPERSSN